VLAIPDSSGSGIGVYDPWTARSLIVQDAAIFGMNSTLPLAVAWEESGFNQTLTSSTGAIGVMQVEPYTGTHISQLLGRHFNLYDVADNVYAGVYWLSVLLRYYGWNERLAVAAYYQGTRSLARVGMYADTRQYVANVMALQLRVAA
jgi:soluble lytic murein transglycosylase-like protein